MKRILLVDDVTINLRCASEILNDSYEIITAKSGRKALLALKETIPDVILLDVEMPEMDGYDVMSQIKAEPGLADIPVILLTEGREEAQEEKGLLLGAVDFISKPFVPEKLQAKIEEVLNTTEHGPDASGIHKDILTGLPERAYLIEQIEQMQKNRESGVFLLLDIDNFKLVNENYGYSVGDMVLKKAAEVLLEEAPYGAGVCRVENDSFAVLMQGNYANDKIRNTIRRLIAGIEYEISEMISPDADFKVSASVGVARMPEDGSDITTLYKLADKALYYVKQNGKRGYHFYRDNAEEEKNPDEEESLINLMQLERLIREKEYTSGAYRVEYQSFKRIYHFVSRCMERKSQDAQIVLFTISESEDHEKKGSIDEKAMELLEKAISKSLRRGDVTTRCGSCQYVVILMNATDENGDLVAGRIRNKFVEMMKDDTLVLTYERQSIEKKK